LQLESPRLNCSIADAFGYKVVEALSKISNKTDNIVAYMTVASKDPTCVLNSRSLSLMIVKSVAMTSDHVMTQLGDLEAKKKETSAVKHKTAGNYSSERPNK